MTNHMHSTTSINKDNATVLYHRTSVGKMQEWEIWTEDEYIFTRWGLQWGKKRTSENRATRKNIGKWNETSPSEQAICEMHSMIALKRDKGYHDTPTEAGKSKTILPMLAKDWFKVASKQMKADQNAMVFVQGKLDGFRCLAIWDAESCTVRLVSRGNKEYSLPHITESLVHMCTEEKLDSMIFDGELYNHDLNFQDISKAIKKPNENTSSIRLHVYDIADENLLFVDRYNLMKEIETKFDRYGSRSKIVFLETITTSTASLPGHHDRLVSEGYEGLIVRTVDLPYKFGYRSGKLLKYKSFDDAEFIVQSFSHGSGKFKDMAIFTCELDDGSGNTFKVMPRGTAQQRQQYYIDGDKYIGKLLTVIFFGRSDNGIPRFPVGKCFRTTKDLPPSTQ